MISNKINILIFFAFSVYLLKAENFWEKTSFPFETDSIQSIKVDMEDNIYVATRKHGIVRSTDHGLTWEQKNKGLDTIRCWNICNDSLNNLYVSAFPIGIYKSTDRAENWEIINQGIVGNNGLIRAYNLEATKDNKLFAWIREDQIYKSTNLGLNWFEVTSKSNLSKSFPGGLAINYNNVIFAVPSDFEGIYRSTDLGLNWKQLIDSSNVRVLYYALNNIGNIFVYIYNLGLYISTNDGESFKLINNIEKPLNPQNIFINKSNHIYRFDSQLGLYVSYNNTESWFHIDTSKLNRDIFYLSSNKEGYLFGGTFGKGLYRSKYPMRKFFLHADFSPEADNKKLLGQGDSMEYNVTISMKDSSLKIVFADISILNELNNEKINFKSDSLGAFKYRFIVPMNRDSGEYAIKFYISKFGYEILDTIVDKIKIKKFVGINENINKILKKAIDFIPNPSNDNFLIRLNNFAVDEVLIELADIKGSMIIQQKEFVTNIISQDISLNTSNLSPGEYFIIITQGYNRITNKLIIK